MIRPTSFDDQPADGCVNLGLGQPSGDLLPLELLARASAGFFSGADARVLNYGERQGDCRLRRALAGFLGAAYGQTVRADSLFLSAGNSQALDFVCARFTRPGDTVVVEEPSYFLAFRIFRDHGLNIVSVPMDEQGMQVDALEELVRRERPRLVYTIPSFHNPTGINLASSRRQRLAELSTEHDFLVVADEVYQMLYFDQPPPPPMAAWLQTGQILSLGSFSKILAPALRLGWIQTNEPLMQRLLASGMINSGGSLNHVTSMIVHEALEQGSLEPFIVSLRASLAQRSGAMDRALREHLSDRVGWTRPEGGYFYWLELPEGSDAQRYRAAASAAGTGFQPGTLFSSRQALNRYLRLSFAYYPAEDIQAGVRRLAGVLGRPAGR